MSDEQSSQPTVAAQHEALKEKARLLGINPGNSGIDELRRKINEKMVGPVPTDESQQIDPTKMTENEIRKQLETNELKLVRCRIYNNNPSKVDLRGELICVGNKYLGMIRKMIPFGESTDEGYHIPLIIFNELKQRKYQQIIPKKVNGQIEVVRKMAPEYTLEVLPMLTKAELEELAVKQAAAERLGA